MKPLVFFISLIAVCYLSNAQQSDIAKIQTVLTSQLNAWNDGDIPGYMNGYWKNDSLKFIGQNGITRGWKATLERYQKVYSTRELMGHLTFRNLNFAKLSDRYYFVTGSWHLRRNTKDTGGWFSLLFKKINNQWLIIVDHTS